ncbi:hypothetical protein KJ603_00550 [Patescibacteria group bacterium]|nr:hypothetical protein [Patescibacteria group bacterium]
MRKRSNKFFNRKEVVWTILIIIAGSVYYYTFWFHMIFGFINHCVVEWPVRWDAQTCWNEQKPSAKEKASESASIFIP